MSSSKSFLSLGTSGNMYKSPTVKEIMDLLTKQATEDFTVRYIDSESRIDTQYYKQAFADMQNHALVRQCVMALARDFDDDEFAACLPTKTIDDKMHETVRFVSSDFVLEYKFEPEYDHYTFEAWKLDGLESCAKSKSNDKFTGCALEDMHTMTNVSEYITNYALLLQRVEEYLDA